MGGILGTLLSQEMPENNPRLTPLPGVQVGVAPVRIIPTKQLLLSTPTGWTIADTFWLVGAELDIRLLHFEWLDLVWDQPGFSGGSDLGWRTWFSLNGQKVPSLYPQVIHKDGRSFSGLYLQPSLQEFYIANRLRYDYGRRGSLYTNLEFGLANTKLYRSSGVGLLEGSGTTALIGVGWQYTLSGIPGTRIRLNTGLDYEFRSFDIGDPPEGTTLPDGSSTGLTPVQTIKLSGPTIRFGIEAGEFLRSRYIPFRDPIEGELATFGIGFGLPRYSSGETVLYDSLNSDLNVSFMNSLMQQYEIRLFRYNWLYLFLKQADLDLLSGVTLRYSKTYKPSSLPSNWPRDFVRGEENFRAMLLAPRIQEISFDHELVYPLSKRFLLSYYAGTGSAKLQLYENVALKQAIRSQALTWHLGVGLGFTVSGDAGSRIQIGADLKYYRQVFDIDLEAQDLELASGGDDPLTPIRSIDLSQPVFSLQVGWTFGGKPNLAYEAHNKFQEGKYEEALNLHQDFVTVYPWHHNVDQVKIQIEEMKDSVAAEYYHDVQMLVKRGQLQQAYSNIRLGGDPRMDWIAEDIVELKSDIAMQALRKASWSIGRYDYNAAEEWILLAIKADPEFQDVAVILLSRAFLIRAAILYQAKLYDRSLVWLDRAEVLSNRYEYAIEQLRRKVGDGRLEDANEGILREDRLVVHDAMEDARSLNPLLAEIVDRYMDGLETAIDYYADQEIGAMKRLAMDELLDDVSGLDLEDFQPRIGMKAVIIKRYVGEPQRKFREDEFELWVYEPEDQPAVWLYIREGLVERIEKK